MENNKKINRSGGITLPASLRRDYGIDAGERVNIQVDSEGVIRIKRIEGSCVFCHSNENLQKYNGRYICGKCLQAIGGMDHEHRAVE